MRKILMVILFLPVMIFAEEGEKGEKKDFEGLMVMNYQHQACIKASTEYKCFIGYDQLKYDICPNVDEHYQKFQDQMNGITGD